LIDHNLAARVDDQTVANQAVQLGAVQGWRCIDDRQVEDHAILVTRVQESTIRARRVCGGHVCALVALDRPVSPGPVLQIVEVRQAARRLDANQARHRGDKR
jgi:hypothetical protein